MGLINKRVYRRQPNSALGWVAWDAGRDKKQALSLAKSYPKDMPIIIMKSGKTRGKNKATFPYTLFMNERFMINSVKRNKR